MKLTKHTLLILSLLAFTFSCDKAEIKSPDEILLDLQGETGFVGPVFNTDAYVAVLVSNEEALIYVCNGEDGISEWFKAPITDMHNFNVTNDAGASVEADFSGESFNGKVTLANKNSHNFSAFSNDTESIIVQRAFGDLVITDKVDLGWVFFSKKDSEGEARPDKRGAYIKDGVFQTTPDAASGITNISIGNEPNVKTYKVKQFGISRNSPTTASIVGING
jgi:hypothetical protein